MRYGYLFPSLGPVALAFVLVLAPSLVLAAGIPTIVPCNGLDCSVCSLATLVQNILNASIYIAVFLSAILFAWAGLKYLTAPAGSDVTSAKKIFWSVLVGLLIILTAWLVIDVVMSAFVGHTVLPWNKIC